jgi:hypothetical protein
MTPRQKIFKTHLILIGTVVLNLFCYKLSNYGLNEKVIFFFKIIIYLTGIFMFFKTIRPFEKISIYFSLYILTPIIIILSWLGDGIFGGVLASIFFFIFLPTDTKYKDENFVINNKFQGFLGSCCSYDIIENKCFVFQKKLKEIRITDEHNFNISKLNVSDNKINLFITIDAYNYKTNQIRTVDTTLVFDIE